MTSRPRPVAYRSRTDSEEGDHIFRFPVEPPEDVAEDDLFRWTLEQQLVAILDLVELSVGGEPVHVDGYRLLNERDYRPLPEV